MLYNIEKRKRKENEKRKNGSTVKREKSSIVIFFGISVAGWQEEDVRSRQGTLFFLVPFSILFF
jgi:hypothetical protein